MLDVAKSDAGIGYSIIMEASKAAPEIGLLPFDYISGTEMKLTVNTVLPTVGFRKVNEGAPRSNGLQEERVFQCFNLDHQLAVDQAAARKSADVGRFLENKAVVTLEALFQKVSKQVYYGTNSTRGDAKGFPGLLEQALTDADHVVDATGSTAKTSVWMVRLGRETLELLGGNSSSITFDEGDWIEETIYDASGNPIPALTKWLRGDLGLRLANKNCAVRIKNLSTDFGKGLTDALLGKALELFTEFGPEPTHIIMNGRSREQLRTSRTNTGSNEKGSPPPVPADWMGIPIIRTSGLVNSEA